jgi:hypothetical protein
MLDYVAQELSAASGWRRLLEAYALLSAPSGRAGVRTSPDPAQATESHGWVPRVTQVDGVEAEQLSVLHGKLIAMGLLSFEVTGKFGIQYQLSPLGRRTLERGSGVEDQAPDEAASLQSGALDAG